MPPRSVTQLEDAINSITNEITEAIELASRKFVKPTNSYEFPRWLRQKIADKNRLRRIAQRSFHPQDKARYNRARSQLNREIRAYSEARWNSFLAAAHVEDHSIWELLRICKGRNSHIPTLHSDGGDVWTDEEKAETFATAFEQQFSPNPNTLSFDLEPYFTHTFNTYTNIPIVQQERPHITYQLVREICSKLKSKKASGPDNISNMALKQLTVNMYAKLAVVFNKIIEFGYFPESWKLAKIFVIHKPGRPINDPGSYRPISLLSNLSKVFERIIHSQVTQHLETHAILRPEQYGFRSGRSTELQLLRVVDHLRSSKIQHLACAGLFLDIAKAFDRVWLPGLLYKLHLYNFPPYIVQLIHSYLSGRKFFVSVNNKSSMIHPITAGIAQGSILGPVLFSIYINDFPSPPSGFLALYADDTAIITRAPRIDDAVLQLNEFVPQI